MTERRRVRIEGRVQGVGFRWFTSEAAAACGLTGWVKNLPDGAVQAEAQGEVDQLDTWLDAVGRGPVFSSVSSVEFESIPVEAGESSFDIN